MKLLPHPVHHTGVTQGLRVIAGAKVSGERLELQFKVEAEEGLLPVALRECPPISARRTTELWKATCFEAFFGVKESDRYFEFNGALSGDWDLYEFDSYRSGMRPVPVAGGSEPVLQVLHSDEKRLHLSYSFPVSVIEGEGSLGRFGITSVLRIGDLPTYWALHHGGEKPDFHLRSGFIYDPIRN